MTHFALLMLKIRLKEGKRHYEGIKLSEYNKSFSTVKEKYYYCNYKR